MRLTRWLALALASAAVAQGADTAGAAAAPAAAPAAAAIATGGSSGPVAGPAPSPAPGSTGPEADILNIMEARAATFVNATSLVLAGLTQSVQWVVDGSSMRQTGKIPLAKWLGPDFQKNGSWLASPAAVMHASVKGGNDTANVIRLSDPVYNVSANSVYFTYTPITAASQLSLHSGAANTAVGSPSTSAPPVGVLLQDVAVFVDDALPVAKASDSNIQGGTKLGFAPLGGGLGRRGGTSNEAGTYDGEGGGGGRGIINVGLGGCYYPGGFNNFGCGGYGYYGGAFG